MDPLNPSREENPSSEREPEETTPLRPDPAAQDDRRQPPPNQPPPPFPMPNYGQWQPLHTPRPRRGCLFYFLLFFFLAAVALAILFVGLPAYFLATGRGLPDELAGDEAPTLRESFVPGAAPAGCQQKIALIDVHGMILSGRGRGIADTSRIIEELEQARRDELVVAVLLDMNTPGGEVTASDEIHRAVELCRQEKPVVTCMRSLAASGGYYIAAGSSWIVANKHTLTGSIGVIMHSLNYADFLDRWGLKVVTIKSGEMKDMMAGSRPNTEAEREYIDSLVQETFHGFAEVVAAGRSRFATVDDVLAADFADGRVLTGPAALEAGLVDQIGYFDDAVIKATSLAGRGPAKLVSYRRRSRLSDLLLELKAEQNMMTEMVPAELRALRPGCLYALWPGALTGEQK